MTDRELQHAADMIAAIIGASIGSAIRLIAGVAIAYYTLRWLGAF